jgi:hypothetical protein
MRKTRLKEKNTDLFLQVEAIGDKMLLLVDESGNMVSQFTLTVKQVAQLRDLCIAFNDEFFKRHKVTSKDKK